ncbi:MAG: autotransporter-associated beta strand repeat-containing protein [Planctomycetota bacterium]|nr:autotransporter-associated beta strand repeat-containing protein [Planctomycetota bacterium]
MRRNNLSNLRKHREVALSRKLVSGVKEGATPALISSAPTSRMMRLRQKFRTALLLGLMSFSQALPGSAADLYWDPVLTVAGNNTVSGVGLGGAGTWDTTLLNWYNGTNNIAWTNANNDTAFFAGTAGAVTLATPITVGGLTFRTTAYSIDAGASGLTFGAPNNAITLENVAAATINGTILGTGNVSLGGGRRRGLTASILTLGGTSAGGWTGATTIGVAQTLSLTGLNQGLLSTSSITMNGGGLATGISLNNTTNAEAAVNRVSDTAPITSNGGNITVTNTAAAVTLYNELIGAVTLNSGRLNVVSTNALTSGTSTLTLGGLTRSGTASIGFGIGGLSATGTTTALNRILITGQGGTAANQIIGAWATVGTATGVQTDYAAYNINAGVANTLGVQGAGIAATAETTWTNLANAYTQNGGAVTLTASRAITALRNTNTAATSTALGAFNLDTFGLLNAGTGLWTISGGGALRQQGTAAANLHVNTGNTGGITISAPINDNTGALTLVKDGAGGTLTLSSAASTFSGGLVINSGTVSLADNSNLGALSNNVTFNGNAILAVSGNVVDVARGIVLNNGAIGTLNTTTATANNITTYSGIISGDGGVAITNTTGTASVNLTGANTFTGPVQVASGLLSYSTVSDNGGPASNLGQGTDSISLSGGTFNFIGSSNQSTNRAILLNANSNLGSNGTASITYAGPIIAGGSNPTFNGTGATVITGGVSQTGTAADWTYAPTGAGTLAISGTPWSIADDFTLTGAGPASVVSLNSTGVYATNGGANTEARLFIRNGTLSFGADNPIVALAATGVSRLSLGDGTTAGTGTLVMNGFDQSIPTLDLGSVNTGFDGAITGGAGSLLTVGTTLNLNRGTIASDVSLAGAAAIVKAGLGTVTMSSDNSGLTGTSTRVDAGNLILDYTTQNNNKLSSASVLDFRGGTLTLNGNAAGTTLAVPSTTFANGGANSIVINAGAAGAVLNLNAVTRGALANDSTVRFVLPTGAQSATNGITTDTVNNNLTSNGILGGWATVDDGTGVFFARNATNGPDGNIVAANATTQDSVNSWTSGINVTDSSGFSGTLANCLTINSLRFNANGASTVAIPSGGGLRIASGGILMTNIVASGSQSISGGTLSSGINELIFTQDSTQTLSVSSRITGATGITKAGTGVLTLSGSNDYSGATDLQSGTLIASGGTAIGDNSVVTLADDQASTIQFLNNESIGGLAGGNASAGLIVGTVDVGSNTLTVRGGGGYAGVFTGSGVITRNTSFSNAANVNLTGVSSGFTGTVNVDGGLLQFSGLGAINASVINVNSGGNLLLDNNGGTRSGARILDTTPINLNSANGSFATTTVVRGLAIRTDQNATTSETIGSLNFASGANYLTGDASGTTGVAILTASNFVRTNNATVNARARAMGATTGDRSGFRIATGAAETTFVGTLVGGGGAAASQNISIVPWGIGETLTAGTTDLNMGNSLITYVTGAGFRALDFATEYNTLAAATATQNARTSLTANATAIAGKTVNSLVLHNATTTGTPTWTVTGTGAGQTLAVTSGALLFTRDTGAATASGITLGSFDGGITTAGALPEYVIHVVNPDSASTTKTLTATISSNLTTTADVTKAGRGILVLSGTNTAGGNTKKTTISEGILQIASLGNIGGNTGALVFSGGTLRLGAGFTGDVSTRTVTFLNGGGTIDTNGVSSTIANSFGTGTGSFTKAGAGNLTLNAAAGYSGNTTVSAGRLILDAGTNTLPSGGGLTLSGGSVQLGSVNPANQAVTSLSGASATSAIVGGNSTPSVLTVNQDSSTTYAGLIGGAGANENNISVVKNGIGNLTLGGVASTFTGGITVNSGTLTGGNNANTFGANTNAITLGATSGTADATLSFFNSQTYANPITVAAGSSGTATIVLGATTGSPIVNGPITINKDLLVTKEGTTGVGVISGGITGTGNLLIRNEGTSGTINLTTAAINNVGTIVNKGFATGATTISAPIGTSVTSVIQDSATSALILSTPTNTFGGSIAVRRGTLSFANGVGTPFASLSGLSLGVNENTGLELDVADGGTDTLTTSTAASVSNVTTLFIKDVDITSGNTYNLLVDANNGLGTAANYLLNLPGYTGSSLSVTPGLVQLTAGTLVTSDVYWAGGASTAWNTVVPGAPDTTNFSTNVAGSTLSETLPGKGQKVIFQADNLVGGGPLSTTLEQGFTINALEFRPSGTAANTARITSIAPGSVTSNAITIRPTSIADGINLLSGSSGSVNISANVAAGTNQTWTVSDAPVELTGTSTTNLSPIVSVSSTTGLTRGMPITGTNIPANATILSVDSATQITLSANASATATGTGIAFATQQLNVSGSISGTGNITKAGPGRLVLSGGGSGYTGTFSANSGITEITVGNALSGIVSTPGTGAPISIGPSGTLYVNAAATTLPNNLTINGGTLSAGGGNQTYSGTVNIASNSNINMRDLAASATFSTTARNITLSGVVSGAGNLTIDSSTTLASGNALNGTLTLTNANTWTGDVFINQGSFFLNNLASPSFTGNNVTFNSFGRVNIAGLNTTLNRTGTLNLAAGAIGEVGVDNTDAVPASFIVNQTGAVNLGAGGTGASLRSFFQDDQSTMNIDGAVNLGGNSSISVAAAATRLLTINGVINDGANSYSLAINDDAGGWAQTNGIVRLTNANTYDGGTTLASGILQLGNKDALGTGALTVSAASTLQATIPLSGANALANPITLDATLTASGTNDITLSGPITGIGGLTKASASTITTLTISNTNSYSGTTTLSGAATLHAGVIAATANNALGTGPVSVLFNTNTLSTQLTLSGGITLGNSVFNTTGVGTDGTINGILRSVSGSNTISGNLNLQGGGGSSTYRADTGAGLTVNGFVGSTANAVRDMTLVGGGNFNFGGVIRDSNQLVPNAADRINVVSTNTGATTLSGTNTYTGTTTSGLGSTLVAGSTQAFGIGSAASVDGTLRLAGFSNSIGSLAGTATGIVENSAVGPATLSTGSSNTSTTFSGLIQNGIGGGALSLTKTGTGAMTLSGANTYGGGTTLSGGVLIAANDSALGTGALSFSGAGQRLVVNDGVTITNNITIGTNAGGVGRGLIENSGPGNATVSGGTITINNGPAGGGTFASASGGTLTIASAITSSVPVTIRTGTVILSGGGSYSDFLVTGTARLGANNGLSTLATLDLGASAAGDFDLAGFNQQLVGITRSTANAGIIGNSSTTTDSVLTTTGTSVYSGIIQNVLGAGTRNVALTVNGGALTLSGTNTYTGVTTISSGTLQVGNGTDAGSIETSSGIINNAALVYNVGAGTRTYGNVISGTGSITQNSTGGTLTLSGTNIYTGATSVGAGGSLVAGSTQAFGVNSATTVTGTLRLASFSNSIGSLAGAGTVENANAAAATLTTGGNNTSTVFSGLIQDGTGGGVLTLAKTGTGAMTLSGTNTYTGGTTFNAGTLVVNTEASLGATSGALTVTGNSSVQLAAAFDTTRNYVLNAGVLTVDTQAFNQTNSGTVSGIGGLAKSGTGALTLSGTNTYSGTTNVGAGGSLVAGSTQAFGVNSAVSVTGALQLAGFSNSIGSLTGTGTVENANATAVTLTTGGDNTSTVFSGLIQDGAGGGALSLLKTGTGIQTISGANTFTGATVISGGILLANNVGGSALGTGGVTVTGTGILGGTGGSISGAVALANGTLSPGASIGTLAIGSASGTGSLFVEYNSTAQTIDVLNVTGALNLDNFTLNFADLGAGSLSNPSYVFATYGSLSGITNTFTSVIGTPAGYSLDYAFGGNNIALVTAVPEPSTLALLTVAIVGGGLYRRSRNQKKNVAKS